MKRLLIGSAIVVAVAGCGALASADTTAITAGLNAPIIGASGGSQVYWGPIVSQSSLALSGNTNTNYPQKFAGTSISGSGGAAGSRQYCVNPGDPTSGPGTVVPPSAVPVYEWNCDVTPPPAAPQVDFAYYKYLAQLQGNACAGQACYNGGASANFSGLYDPVCSVNGQTKVWYFEGDVSFSGGTYICGILLSKGSVTFTGGGAGDITLDPPSDAWQEYQVATPNGTPGMGDSTAADEYPGDDGFNAVKPYDFKTGGGGFNGDPVSFKGYVYATTGYTAGGHTLIVGAVQFGQGAASTSGGGTIFYEPQLIFSPPPANTVATPIITPPGGSFTGNVSVTLAEPTQGASIYYTTDGSVPSANATLYGGPIVLSTATTLQAIGIRSDLNPSAVASATFVFTTGPANQAPVVSAGAGQTITLPSSAALQGSATDDGLPNPPASLIYAWNKMSGPGTVTFADPSQAQTTSAFSQAGTYVLRLVAFDGQLAGYADVQIIVNPVPPPAVQFSAATYAVSEAAGFATITVTRSGTDLSGTSTVQFATADGAATAAGVNYVGVRGSLTFAVGVSSQRFDVPVINDGFLDGNKTVLLSLSAPANATLGSPSQAVLTITDAGASSSNPGSPFISQLVPYAAPVNQASAFEMRVLGDGFDPAGAQVIWNNGPALTVVSRSTAEIDVTLDPSAWSGTAGAYPVQVVNPGAVKSNIVNFTVEPLGAETLPPWVAQQPLATPNPVYTKTTQLSVLGGTFSPGGESVLTYDWEPVGAQPAVVVFSANKTNGAKNVTATFSGPGLYHLQVIITDTVTGLAVLTKVLDVTVVSTATSLVVTPKTQYITSDQQPQFTATVKDQFGVVMSPTLSWTSTAGSLSAGKTTAVLSLSPASAVRTAHVTATMPDDTLSDSADVYVLYGAGGIGNLDQAVPAPVPYRSTSGLPGVTFKNLNPSTRIRIFTVTGRLVTTLRSDSGGDVLWDLRNASGERVASGVYLYMMDLNGAKKDGKLVLIL
jgi:hypothetical protein